MGICRDSHLYPGIFPCQKADMQTGSTIGGEDDDYVGSSKTTIKIDV